MGWADKDRHAFIDFEQNTSRAMDGIIKMEFNLMILLTGLLICAARIVDVSLGTLRTISIVHGRTWMSFWLGFFEVAIWLTVISTVIHKIKEVPFLGLFYAFGFAMGNMVGIGIEKKLAMGCIILRVISREYYREMAERVRLAGYAVTTFQGEGRSGPVVELYIVCRRRDLSIILSIVREIEPDAFYITEQAGAVSKVYRPILQPVTGWRAVFKKK
ncbi:MAG: DUF5698 domain-containing protein [Desulfobulbaceae bacterium]|nr:DUF5698 domain-containing protein [Desulfobulbaceae bacterium]